MKNFTKSKRKYLHKKIKNLRELKKLYNLVFEILWPNTKDKANWVEFAQSSSSIQTRLKRLPQLPTPLRKGSRNNYWNYIRSQLPLTGGSKRNFFLFVSFNCPDKEWNIIFTGQKLLSLFITLVLLNNIRKRKEKNWRIAAMTL